MCGIIGIVGKSTVSDRLIAGLKKLEYRGYDSSGVAVIQNGALTRARAKGKIKALETAMASNPIDGPVGIAHTRWATHGVPNENNAHPHFAGRVCIVHNGIIENFLELRQSLNGRNYMTDTDTEVVAHLVDNALDQGLSGKDAFRQTIKQLSGAYAFGMIIDGEDDTLFAARAGSPLAIGVGDDEMYLGSDALALIQLTNQIIYLEEGDWAVLTPNSYEIYDKDDNPVERSVTVISGGPAMADKGGYDHYMLKEIHEQPETVSRTLSHYIDELNLLPALPAEIDFKDIDRVILVACGTASYAGAVAKYWFEQIAGLAVDVDIASEFRYRNPVLSQNSLFIAVSQSGETADTLAALRYCQSKGVKTAALVNVMTSTMAREADIALPTHAGPEIGVASTKAFTSQLTALAVLALQAAHDRGQLDPEEVTNHVKALISLPGLIATTVQSEKEIRSIAKELAPAQHAFFLGRGVFVPIAFEGSLKLKEISYIHAEAYAAGELKHGPIALIETGTPVIVVAPWDKLFEKTLSNAQEVLSRGAEIYLLTDAHGLRQSAGMARHVLTIPDCHNFIAPILSTIPLQLLAYHTALHLGTDVDQPRNLAKSVTVE